MGGCSIRNCKVRTVKGGAVSFFTFPVKESVANEWLRHCKPKTKAKTGKFFKILYPSVSLSDS